jgi:DNA-directed RNA polymerase specialized sigma24 family protein
MNLDEFLEEMCRRGSIWNDIIDNIIGGDGGMKRALISEIAISFLERREKIEEILNEQHFKYYFIQTIMNQVRSNTSPLYKNHKMMIAKGEEFDFSHLDMIENNDIEEKIEREEKLLNIEEKLLKIKISWFEGQMFNLYYKQGLTYRQIESEWGINFLTAYSAVKRVKEKLMKIK